MAVANIKAQYNCDVAKLWDIVTSATDYGWRSDIGRIEVSEPGKKFVEYTKDGYATHFTITAFEHCRLYEFDMENDNMKGHWTGKFTGENGVAAIDFTENVIAKKWFMKPFVGMYLKRAQKTYVNDLNKAVIAMGQ